MTCEAMKKCEAGGVKRRRAATMIAIPLVGLALAWGPGARYFRAARLLTGFGDARPVDVRVEEHPLAGLRSRTYRGEGPPLLLVHGAHPGGVDEPRLVRFASLLAEAGFVVSTPEIPALRALRFDPGAADQIAAAARALGRPTVGVVGISFGGGLALVAAADEPAIGAVWTIGAHHDAARLAAWWRGEPIAGPDGARVTEGAERYGAQVLAHAYAEDYFAHDAEGARAALGDVLRGTAPQLDALHPEARARVEALRQGRAPDREALARLTERHAAELAAVSPAGRLARVRVPVFVLHGEGDPLVAPSEAEWIARELPSATALRTPLIGHADLGEAGLSEQWAVVSFAASALDAM